MTPGIDRRQFLAGAAVTAAAAAAATATAAEAGAAAAAPAPADIDAAALQAGSLQAGTLEAQLSAALPPGVTLPTRGIYDSAPAATWNDGLLTGNGEIGAVFYGSPSGERVIFNHHRFVLPNGTRDIKQPVIAGRLNQVRDLCLAGKYPSAQSTFAGSWKLIYTQSFHPGPELVISTPANSTASNYARITDFSSGEARSTWTDGAGTWLRHGFASRPDKVIVHELLPAAGQKITATLSYNTKLDGVPSSVKFAISAAISAGSGYLDLRGTYPSGGAYGYEGVTRVVATGGTIAVSGSSIVITNATRVLLLTAMDRYESSTAWNAKPLQARLASVSTDYAALLARHTAVHGPVYARSRLDLKVSAADRQLATSALIARQNANQKVIDVALLERMYDAGRYHFISSAGILPPRLTGLWAGSWNASWADDFTTDANVNFQIAGGNILDLGESMQSYLDLILGQLADWRVNAKDAYGMRGFVAPTRTDGEDGHLFHFDSGFSGEVFIGGADWLLYPLLEYYHVTGDQVFLKDKLGPALMELALFFEDFLTRVDSGGKVIFVPSYSPENAPGNTSASVVINSTFDVAAGKHALQAAIEAANLLGLEQGSGQGVARWKALLARFPAYLINAQGGLQEWSWPGLTDRQNHRHVSHLYAAWPLHEINPEEQPVLVARAVRALELRKDENLSGHGSLHRALAATRVKDGAKVYANVLKILGNKMVFRSLMTSHNPNLTTYNADSANTLPAVLAESLVHSRPGMIELLPAVPAQLGRGTITDVRGRNRVRVVQLDWDLGARTVTAILRSDVAQTTTLISRRGIASIGATILSDTPLPGTPVGLVASPLGERARLITLPAGQDVRVVISLPASATQYHRVVNRGSGKVLDVAGGSSAVGAKVVQTAWAGQTSQQWQLVANSDNSFHLVNRSSGRVLQVPGGSTTTGVQLTQDASTGANQQWWRLAEATTAGYHTLANVKSGKFADIQGSSTADGAAVVQSNGSSSAKPQQWQVIPT